MHLREGHQLTAMWWAEPDKDFAKGGMSRHHQGPSLQPEHSTARGKEALPLPLSTTAFSRASRLGGGHTNVSESGGFTLSLEEPMPPPGKHCTG